MPLGFDRGIVAILRALHKRPVATKAFVAQIYPSILFDSDVVSLMN